VSAQPRPDAREPAMPPAAPGRWARLRLAAQERLVPGEQPRMLAWAGVIGFLAACTTVAFSWAMRHLVGLFTGHVGAPAAAAMTLGPLARLLTPAAGGLLAGLVLVAAGRWLGSTRGGDYMEAVTIGEGRIPAAPTLVRSASSLLSIGSGASIGREGPMVQLAALVASLVTRYANLQAPRRRLLVACGAAAGITSAYNAPVAGALFVGEIVLGSIAFESFGPILVAAVVADLTLRHFLAAQPLYRLPGFESPGALQALTYVLLGLVAGALAPLFLGALDGARALFRRLRLPLPLSLAAGGLVVGAISIDMPQVWGNGYSVVNAILAGEWVGRSLLLLFALKLLATFATVGSGAIGGVFTPTLFVGAALGAAFGQLLGAVAPSLGAQPTELAAVAMGAFLAATTHAPFMAVIMIFEMTGSYPAVLPLVLACVPAYGLARVLRPDSIYAGELRRGAAARVGFASQKVADLMRADPPTVDRDDDLGRIAAQFGAHRFQYLYVIDAQRRYLGAVSLHDLRVLLAQPQPQPRRAVDILVPGFAVLGTSQPLDESLAAFSSHRGERLPVVDDAGRLAGALWKTDVILALHDGLSRTR